MKFLLMSFVALSLSVSTFSSVQAQSTFSDVPDNHWAAAAVKRLAEAGIIVGRPVSPANSAARKTATSSTRTEQKVTSKTKKVAQKSATTKAR